MVAHRVLSAVSTKYKAYWSLSMGSWRPRDLMEAARWGRKQTCVKNSIFQWYEPRKWVHLFKQLALTKFQPIARIQENPLTCSPHQFFEHQRPCCEYWETIRIGRQGVTLLKKRHRKTYCQNVKLWGNWVSQIPRSLEVRNRKERQLEAR